MVQYGSSEDKKRLSDLRHVQMMKEEQDVGGKAELKNNRGWAIDTSFSTRPAVMLIQLSIYWRIDMNHWRPSTSGQRWKRRADAEPLTEERHHTKVQSGVKLGPK
ncbi:hypothetical protein FocTR4_00010363, partial [Fusarium oxysporum f. sp. cubense]